MKKFLFVLAGCLASVATYAQKAKCDSVFNAYIYNDEYKVYIDMNLYKQDINVPGQEVLGNMPGYFGAIRDSRKWLFASAKIEGKNSALLDIVNDYGSEDLTAILTYDAAKDVYRLKQTGGSRLKIVVNRKWQKIPAEITFARHKRVANTW